MTLEEAAPSLFVKGTMRDGTRHEYERLYRIAQGQAEFCSVSLTRIARYPSLYGKAVMLIRSLRDNGRITHIPEKGFRPVWYRWAE